MKSINVYFNDDEFEILKKKKGERTWESYIKELIMNEDKGGKENGIRNR